jgi:two-component system, NarL family, sensor kinase
LDVAVNSKGDLTEIPIVVRTVLFRIAQEAITNAVRHSEANHIDVLLHSADNQLYMGVSDNGKGFDVQATLHADQGQPSWGLLGMMERVTLVGGECHIESTAGQGTCVSVTLPLNGSANGRDPIAVG